MRLVLVTFFKVNSFQTAGASNLIPMSSIIQYGYYNMQGIRYLGSFLCEEFVHDCFAEFMDNNGQQEQTFT